MDLNELVPAPSSKKIAQVANKIFGYAIDIDRLSESKTKKLYTKVNDTLTVMESREGARAFSNQQFQELRIAKQALEARLEEAKRTVTIDKPDRLTSLRVSKPDYIDIDGDGDKKEPMKKAAKDAKKKTNEGRLGFKDLEKLGAANASKVDHEARRRGSANMEPGDADQLRYKVAKEMGLVESVITEGEVENAELVLAAKDMVDRVQKMLEDIGKMINEDLPPLTDAIRDEMDSSTADGFNNSMSTALQGLLDNLGTARTGVDEASRILVGETPAAEPMGMEEPGEVEAPDAEMGTDPTLDDEEGDDFSVSDAAVGGDDPMGREKA
jgi:hypothetical protein